MGWTTQTREPREPKAGEAFRLDNDRVVTIRNTVNTTVVVVTNDKWQFFSFSKLEFVRDAWQVRRKQQELF